MRHVAFVDMSNVLNEAKKEQVIALGRLGWPLRRIEQETGVRRETAGAYLKAAGIAVRPPGAWGRRPPAKPANENEVTTGSDAAKPTPTINPHDQPQPQLSSCTQPVDNGGLLHSTWFWLNFGARIVQLYATRAAGVREAVRRPLVRTFGA